MSSESPPQSVSKISTLRLAMIFISPIFSIIVFFAAAGTLHFPSGWLFMLWFVGLSYAGVYYLYRKSPALLNERFNPGGYKNQKKWDKIYLAVVVVLLLIWFFAMPLDAGRYHWTTGFPVWVQIFGGILLLISFFFLYRSFTDNPYLSPTVRIQSERKQTVITTGVYGFVRHPMYLGNILMFMGSPMLVGTYYGVLVGIAFSILMFLRIPGEEKMLKEELDGYLEYMKKVKYRVFPFIW